LRERRRDGLGRWCTSRRWATERAESGSHRINSSLNGLEDVPKLGDEVPIHGLLDRASYALTCSSPKGTSPSKLRQAEFAGEVASGAEVCAEEEWVLEDGGCACVERDDAIYSLGQEHRVCTAVPALWRDLFRDVGDRAVRLELRTKEGGDGSFVCYSTCADGAVREETGDEVCGSNHKSSLWWEEVEVRILRARVHVLVCEVASHGFDIVLSATISLCLGLQVFEDGNVQVVVVAVAKVEVASVYRYE
jgi:hypothetical protein